MAFYSTNPVGLLFDAARKDAADNLKQCIASGTAVNIANSGGFIPLILACYNGSLEAAELLIEAITY